MSILLNMIALSVLAVPFTAQSSKCRPSIEFYHIPHGAVSAWVDQPVLNGLYMPIYMIRNHIIQLQGRPTTVLTLNTQVLYLIHSECHSASPKSGRSVTLMDGKTNQTQVITYPMGSAGHPFAFTSPRGELIIECVDTLLFAFNLLLKRSGAVVARIRNIYMQSTSRQVNNISNTFTLEVNNNYKDIRAFIIASSLVVDEYIYPASVEQKNKNCN